MPRPAAAIETVGASVFVIPTDAPESDGTIEWNSTTLVLVEIAAGGKTGIGYTYAARAAADVIHAMLAPVVKGGDAFSINAAWEAMARTVRTVCRPGIAACAISSVDMALWDVKAKLLNQPLHRMLSAQRTEVPVYGSGGFTSYDDARLEKQLGDWAGQGCRWVKMKVGRDFARDPARVAAARRAVGDIELMVDANGGYTAQQALKNAHAFSDEGVTWFEEPVSSDDLDGLRFVREHIPPGMEVAAGEYGFDPLYFVRMLRAGAVNVLQADATRCGGITGFLRAAAICDGFGMPLSSHCAPSAHLAAACAAPRLRHIEWFHDHVRIERMLFDGAPAVRDGVLTPDPSRPGLGVEFRRADAEKFAA
jgi:L-alanine-DL-glutamate epimerase-like enolase superfamily enzyme